MIPVARPATFALTLAFLGSCATAPDPETQSLIESIADKNENVVRLTVHKVPAGETDCKAIASTLATKRGAASDPEDLKAMRTGEVVVMDEPGAIDVTVPILLKEGKHTAAAGVTVKAAVGRQEAIQLARSLATEIERGMSNASMNK